MATIVITDSAVEHLLGSSPSIEELLSSGQGQGLTREKNADVTFVVSGRERGDFLYAVVDADELAKLPEGSMRHAIPRIDRTLKAATRLPLRLPPHWSEYHVGNKVAFFALPREIKGGYRWLAQFDESDRRILFRKLTTPGAEIPLDSYDEPLPDHHREVLVRLIESAKQRIIEQPSHEDALIETFDFDAVGSRAISRSLTLEEWIPRLTQGQKQLLDLPPRSSARVIGPAGSGKTLALCARALLETRNATTEGRTIKLLFATHSWAMAERVDRLIVQLNGGASVPDVVVLPLIQVLKEVLTDTYAGSLSVLGDDSLEGRQLQIELLSDVVQKLSSADIDAFKRHGLSEEIWSALDNDSLERIDLLENLCEEFNGVLLAENIVPGRRESEEQYLKADRTEEMPPFRSRGDRMFALAAYREYLRNLREWGTITTDQLVNDAMRVLETFSWSVRRDVEGYDQIFVDELQLFDAQERLALTLLTQAPASAAFVTAEDPSQGVFSAVSAQWRRELPTGYDPTSVELAAVHRFNEGILRFIRHLYLCFPLNADSVKIEGGTDLPQGSLPVIRLLPDEVAVPDAVAQRVAALSAGLDQSERLAVITLDSSSQALAERLRKQQNVVFIGGFDDIEQLTYTRRATVVGSWQFMGGTQFGRVVVAAKRIGSARSVFARMKELIALYVAASRASDKLELIASGSLDPELRSAVEQGIVLLENDSHVEGV